MSALNIAPLEARLWTASSLPGRPLAVVRLIALTRLLTPFLFSRVPTSSVGFINGTFQIVMAFFFYYLTGVMYFCFFLLCNFLKILPACKYRYTFGQTKNKTALCRIFMGLRIKLSVHVNYSFIERLPTCFILVCMFYRYYKYISNMYIFLTTEPRVFIKIVGGVEIL